jgi:predicted transcriptional regulator
MQIKRALGYINRQIEGLEQSTFVYETIVRPRYEADKQILEDLREKALKLASLVEKIDNGEQVTKEEVFSAVPIQFR